MKKRLSAILIAGAISMSVSGCVFLPVEEEPLAPPLTASQEVKYETTVVERGYIESIKTGSATFVSTRQYDASFEARSGYIKEIYVSVGQFVKAGDPIMELDNDELAVNIEKQKLEVERLDILHGQEISKNGSGSDSAKLAAIELEKARLTLKDYETQYEKYLLVAPADGRVVFLTATTIGEYVKARTTVCRIADMDSLMLSYKGSNYTDFHVGKEITVIHKRVSYDGVIASTPLNVPEDATEIQKESIIIEVPKLLSIAAIGDTAQLRLIVESKEDAVVIPVSALVEYGGATYVRVLEDGVKKEKLVTTGIKGFTNIEITSGLEAGEVLILR